MEIRYEYDTFDPLITTDLVVGVHCGIKDSNFRVKVVFYDKKFDRKMSLTVRIH